MDPLATVAATGELPLAMAVATALRNNKADLLRDTAATAVAHRTRRPRRGVGMDTAGGHSSRNNKATVVRVWG